MGLKHKNSEIKARIINIQNWNCIDDPINVPKQVDGEHCGIPTIYTAGSIELGRKCDFSKAKISILGRRIAI